jgi:MtfA peptidase
MLIVFILGAMILTLYTFRVKVADGINKVDGRTAELRSKIFPIPITYRETLNKYFNYYQRLSEKDKREFEQRMMHFLMTKKFIPRNFTTVTDEMKATIAATAVQLTFGLPSIYFLHFNKIVIYPDDYYSNITKRNHRGEVNPAFGIIVLSWRSFVDGFINPHNAINLGLHEMAHALRLGNLIRNEEFGFLDEEALAYFNQSAFELCNDPERSFQFFRAYACTNEHEFFSVAVENFFERPLDFRKNLPSLYQSMVTLLKQDPLNLLKNE